MSFLKIKRKCQEDPKEVLVLSSKKFKLHGSDEVPVFELATSAVKESEIEDVISKTIVSHDVKSRKFDLEKIRKQIRLENAQHSKNSKYRLLNVLRKLDDTVTDKTVSVIDVIDGINAEKDENPNEYVYDLYYSSTNVDINDPDFIANHYLHEVKNEWDNEFGSEEEKEDDNDDSNDEDNWRNDYPDEDEFVNESENDSEGDLCRKMQKTNVCSDYSLSSDEFDEAANDSYTKEYKNTKHFDYYDEVASDTSDDY